MGQRALYQPAPLAALLQAEQELPLLHVRCSRGRFGPPFPVLVHSKVLPVVLLHHAIDIQYVDKYVPVPSGPLRARCVPCPITPLCWPSWGANRA